MTDVDIIPKSELSNDDIKQIVTNAHDAVLARAIEKVLKAPIVRDGMPKSDFGLTNEVWKNNTAVVANTWGKDWSKTLPVTQCALPYKVFNWTAAPVATGLRFKGGATGAKTLAQIELEDLYGQLEVVGYFNFFDVDTAKQLLYDPNATIYVELIAGANIAQFAELIGYGIMIAEPAGETVK